MHQKKQLIQGFWAVVGLLGLFSIHADAGVFNIPHFVSKDRVAVGVEPELVLSDHAAVGASPGLNAKLTYGLGDSLNMGGAVGTGGGSRGFRVGTFLVFDIFPDIEGQPGAGFATQVYHYRYTGFAETEFSVVPYVSEAYETASGVFSPFVALPTGFRINSVDSDRSGTSVLLSLGTKMQASKTVHLVAELGVAIHQASTYFSGGAVFMPE